MYDGLSHELQLSLAASQVRLHQLLELVLVSTSFPWEAGLSLWMRPGAVQSLPPASHPVSQPASMLGQSFPSSSLKHSLNFS